jgi:molybdopterin-biosynthesis enzyme MoeA-like protein
MAKFCFSLGMALKRVEVIGDDEEEIIEATRRMSKNYDFVVTSGGIGPTCASPIKHNPSKARLMRVQT